MITAVDVPNVGSIHFHNIVATSNTDIATANQNARFPLADIPVTFQLDDIQTNFVMVSGRCCDLPRLQFTHQTISEKLTYFFVMNGSASCHPALSYLFYTGLTHKCF